MAKPIPSVDAVTIATFPDNLDMMMAEVDRDCDLLLNWEEAEDHKGDWTILLNNILFLYHQVFRTQLF